MSKADTTKTGATHRRCDEAFKRAAVAQWQSGVPARRVTPSMSRRGNCYDNAAMESFWSTRKEELVHRTRFESRAQATGAIFD